MSFVLYSLSLYSVLCLCCIATTGVVCLRYLAAALYLLAPRYVDSLERGDISLTQIVDSVVEQETIDDAMCKHIFSCLHVASSEVSATSLLAKNQAALRLRDQEYFGIEQKNQSPSNWATVIGQLESMATERLPSKKMMALVNTAKAIFTLFEAEHEQWQVNEQILAGDDLLPIFIYVVCHCSPSAIPDLAAQCQYMWDLCHPRSLAGEY